MEKYLEKLLLQIRCKKARPYIAEEIRGHIESQIEDNIADGMSYEEAEKNADPYHRGGSADRRAVSASGRGLAAICVVYGSVPGDRIRYSEKGVERYLQ